MGKMPDDIVFKVAHKSTVYDIEMPGNATVADLKSHLENLTTISPALQKLLFKGVLKDESTIEESKITTGSRVILMATTPKDILAVTLPPPPSTTTEETLTQNPSAILEETKHQKIIRKGPAEDAEPGIFDEKSVIPGMGIKALWNGFGVKTRLSFLDGTQEIQVTQPLAEPETRPKN
ncbi:hypothetical protein HDV05_007237 [Chytridiales sp. JEL 0842]|nr:hypothetical protein HDV05_007237 [Chytridiales sp. JEL 0842]